jgi:hypothetical protein
MPNTPTKKTKKTKKTKTKQKKGLQIPFWWYLIVFVQTTE